MLQKIIISNDLEYIFMFKRFSLIFLLIFFSFQDTAYGQARKGKNNAGTRVYVVSIECDWGNGYIHKIPAKNRDQAFQKGTAMAQKQGRTGNVVCWVSEIRD